MMRANNITLGFLLFIGIVGCDDSGTDFCINDLTGSFQNNILSEEDFNTACSLFDRNNLAYNNLIFYDINLSDNGNYHIRCYQYMNNLRIFTNDLIYHFNSSGNYYFLSGHEVKDQILDSESTMDQNNIIEIFLNEFDNDSSYFGDKPDIIDDCFEVEFGYYDLNAGISYTEIELIKVWKVNSKGRKYPFSFINDSSLISIYYDNGIRY